MAVARILIVWIYANGNGSGLHAWFAHCLMDVAEIALVPMALPMVNGMQITGAYSVAFVIAVAAFVASFGGKWVDRRRLSH